MSDIKFSSHDDPTKARVTGSVTVLDKDLPENVKEFIATVFDVVPKLVDLYIEGNASARRLISSWFFSIEMDKLRIDNSESKLDAHDCTLRRIGALGRRLACNACNESFDVEKSRVLFANATKAQKANNPAACQCPACGYNVVGIV